MTTKAPGRNDPCPCGSGVKYKKCCENREQRARIAAVFARHVAQERERVDRYGEVRPPISTDFQDHKIVAVGNTIHWGHWKTFPDFLFHYIKSVLLGEWGNEELSKPLEDRHQILKWYDALCSLQAQTKEESDPSEDGVYASEVDGPSRAYLLLAYDIYVLRHSSALQERVITRLRNQDQFQGARYELFVAATMIRAGFALEHEDESDGSGKHPEFIATLAPPISLDSRLAKAAGPERKGRDGPEAEGEQGDRRS